MDCKGIDLVSPIDRQPQGSFPYIANARILEEGRIDGRPGYTEVIHSLPDVPNSIRRLNDPAHNSYVYVGGVGTSLYAGQESGYIQRDTGYSGDPLSLVTFRPQDSPEAWMYVYDRNKNSKFRRDGVLSSIGIVPPSQPPVTEYGVPAWVVVNDGWSPSGWVATGTGSGAVTSFDRTNAGTAHYSIGSIIYETGNMGWCCIQPSSSNLQTFWMGERMQVLLNQGQPNEEKVVVREVHPAITTTNIASIQYDSGTTGPCSIVFTDFPAGLERNSVILIDTEAIRVLEVVPSPGGTGYSVRANTTSPHTSGHAYGILSWFVYTAAPHVAGESINDDAIQVGVSTGTGGMGIYYITNVSRANGRPVSVADDYLHVSLFISNPQLITEIHLQLDVDQGTTSLGTAFTRNYWTWVITQAQLNLYSPFGLGDSWTDIVIPISSGKRSGSDLTRTLADVRALQVEAVTTGSVSLGFDNWYFFGTYGPTIQPNSPVGMVYMSRFRDTSTGAKSVPGPATRYQLFPLREAVIITPQVSTQSGVDEIDIYRQGGTVTSPLYVGSVENNSITPNSFLDDLPDSAVLSINQPPDLTALQPWPILGPPLAGEVTVVGTTVTWNNGDKFPTDLVNNSTILINGIAYTIQGQPTSPTQLQLTQSAGYLASANYSIASPTRAGQPLPFAFGPLEGPFAPVVFGLGDTVNGGLLYFTNFSDADSASDQNNIEVSTPSSDLVSGAVWNGLCFTGTRDDVFCVRYSYLTTIGASNNTAFQWARVPCPSGFWSRWSVTACPVGVAYLGRDGIYIVTESKSVNITDPKLYPLFPHAGQAAAPFVLAPGVTLYPVDMTQLTQLRLSYCDETLRFVYVDTNGVHMTLIWEIYKERWIIENYANAILYHYLVEEAAEGPNDQEILMLSQDTRSVMKAGGNTDNGVDIDTIIYLPAMDGGDERTQKLYVDLMTQSDGVGDITFIPLFNNALVIGPTVVLPNTGPIIQSLTNVASLMDLSLYRNISARYSWAGGPDGPRLYAWEMSGYIQPYLCKRVVTQFFLFSFPGWKHMRRMYPALISNDVVNLTIMTQDGRTYGPYAIPSTGGRYRVLPQMLDQNIKDLAFALQLDGGSVTFSPFLPEFTIEVKEWTEESYIRLAVFKA
jgi:hypothetical protein